MQQRLERFRDTISAAGLDGFIVPHGDEYGNEYLPPSAERLSFLTGFTGSAGTAIILPQRAVLFRDGRYILQAQKQVDPELFEFAHLIEEPPEAWLARNLPAGTRLGYDPWLHTAQQIDKLDGAVLKAGGILIAVAENPVDAIWTGRPQPPQEQISAYPVEFAGETQGSKRARIVETLKVDGLDAVVMTDPASIAWLLNVRGNDVPCAPLPLSFAILHADGIMEWFVDPAKTKGLSLPDVRSRAQVEFLSALQALRDKRVLVDPAGVPVAVRDVLKNAGAEIRAGTNPCVLPKACKNESELSGSRAAHLRDAVALVKFLSWFEVQDKTTLSEINVSARLEDFRAESNLYRGPSFDTISGSGPNGAVVHYRADEASNRMLDPSSLLLLDSGAQYEDGTTDITRTLPLGTPTPEMREMFTRVLKGHIAIAAIRFPPGTSGVQLDVLARQFLWSSGLNYDHGTGHGVGSYLSVHEGPQRIAPKAEPVELRPGMIVSNEPGYYQPGEYGIRIENLVAVRQGDDGFLEFETLSHVPIDTRLVVADMLSRPERTWLNQYHARTRELLRPLLAETEARWLDRVCAPV